MVWGTPGGDQQDQWSALLLLHHVDRAMNLQEAIDTPAFHSEHWPSSFWPRAASPGRLVVEGRMPPATVEALKEKGHKVAVGGRLVGGPPDGGQPGGRRSSRPPPTRAACRATRSGDSASGPSRQNRIMAASGFDFGAT